MVNILSFIQVNIGAFKWNRENGIDSLENIPTKEIKLKFSEFAL